MTHLKYALMAERLTVVDAEGLLALTRLPIFRNAAYLLWKAFSRVMAFSFRHTAQAFSKQDKSLRLCLTVKISAVQNGFV